MSNNLGNNLKLINVKLLFFDNVTVSFVAKCKNAKEFIYIVIKPECLVALAHTLLHQISRERYMIWHILWHYLGIQKTANWHLHETSRNANKFTSRTLFVGVFSIKMII